NAALGFAGAGQVGHMLRSRLAPAPAKAAHFFLSDLRHYLAPHLDLARPLEALPWALVLAGLAAAALRAARRWVERREVGVGGMGVAGTALFAAVYAVSGLGIPPELVGAVGPVGFRYLAPLTPFVIAAAALLLARLPGWSALVVAGMVGALALGYTARRLD